MGMMYVEDPNKYFNIPYIEYLQSTVGDTGEQLLEEKETEIAQRNVEVGASNIGKTPFIILGLAVIGLVTIVILKKKKII
jgi:hypothetical protein